MQPCRYEPWGAESEEFGTPVMFVPLTFFCAKIILINRNKMFEEKASLRAKAYMDGSRKKIAERRR